MSTGDQTGIRVVAIVGSVRPGNITAKATALVVDELRKEGVAVEVINPAELHLPLPGLGDGADGLHALRSAVGAATGVVMATPEYHGSFSSVIKLVIENLGYPSVLACKPVALLGLAGGQNGAIKSLEHLRSVCSHVGALVLPSLVSVANAPSAFDAEGRCLNPAVERRIRSTATTLLTYIRNHVCPRVTLERMAREAP